VIGHRVKRRLQAAGIRLAAAAPAAALLRAAGRYPPAPTVVPGTGRIVESYGPGPQQVGEWWLPPGTAGGVDLLPTVLLVHGGFWRAGYDRSLEDAVAADLAGRGYLCWVPDYRPSTIPWPATLADVAAAADHLARGSHAARVDPARLSFVGHSAGGHLVLWLAARHRLTRPAAGVARSAALLAGPAALTALAGAGVDVAGLAAAPDTLRPALVVSQAGVGALTDAAARHLGDDAAVELVGGPPGRFDDRYAVSDPIRLLPTGVETVLVHGTADETVPLDQSTAYRDAAVAAGDRCALVAVPGAGHRDHLDPASACGAALRAALAGPPAAR